MPLTVRDIEVLDPFHYNGDRFWDGDQTLYELDLVDGDERDSVLVVVQRGNAFIPPKKVARYVQEQSMSLAELRSKARRPGPRRRAQVSLSIEPGDV